jgi:hypothetical protein
MPDHLKLLANKRDVPYQSLLKMFVAEKIETELKGQRWQLSSIVTRTSRCAFLQKHRPYFHRLAHAFAKILDLREAGVGFQIG